MKLSSILCASFLTFAALAPYTDAAVAQAPAAPDAAQAPPSPAPMAAPVARPTALPPVSECTGPNNLVQNPGFETGTLSPWVVAWPPSADPFTVVSGFPHSGNRAVVMGAVPGVNTLSQTINGTVAGSIYTVCFWLAHDNVPSNAQNSFDVRWNGRRLFTMVSSHGFGYTLYRFSVRATGTDVLRFDAQEVPAFWHLDDVGVFPGGPVPLAREAPVAVRKPIP
jgi:hypothetical protein